MKLLLAYIDNVSIYWCVLLSNIYCIMLANITPKYQKYNRLICL